MHNNPKSRVISVQGAVTTPGKTSHLVANRSKKGAFGGGNLEHKQQRREFQEQNRPNNGGNFKSKTDATMEGISRAKQTPQRREFQEQNMRNNEGNFKNKTDATMEGISRAKHTQQQR